MKIGLVIKRGHPDATKFLKGALSRVIFDDFVCKGAGAGWGAKIKSWDDGGRFL